MAEEDDEQRKAAEALAAVHAHQIRARRAALLPWWFYVAGFALVAGLTAANDFVDVGPRTVTVVALALLAARYILGPSHTWTAPWSAMRGVQGRQITDRRTFVLLVIGSTLAGWAISRYGIPASDDIADTIGLHHYPSTVAGMFAGAFVVALIGASQLVVARSAR